MPHYTLVCPECRAELALTARRLLLRVDEGGSPGGEVLFTCLMCDRTPAVPTDAATVAAMVVGGVTFLVRSEPAVEHPELPAQGPLFTPDDLLDLHDALERDDWLGHGRRTDRPESSG